MESQKKIIPLNWKNGTVIFLISLFISVTSVHFLRHLLIPKEELDAYARVKTLQKAVDQWNEAYPDKKMTDEIDQEALVKAGFMQPLSYDHTQEYYFIGQTAHGPRVKCNKYEENPLLLRLSGDLLLAVLIFVIICSIRGYAFFVSNPS